MRPPAIIANTAGVSANRNAANAITQVITTCVDTTIIGILAILPIRFIVTESPSGTCSSIRVHSARII
jgi:hypothetical protein